MRSTVIPCFLAFLVTLFASSAAQAEVKLEVKSGLTLCMRSFQQAIPLIKNLGKTNPQNPFLKNNHIESIQPTMELFAEMNQLAKYGLPGFSLDLHLKSGKPLELLFHDAYPYLSRSVWHYAALSKLSANDFYKYDLQIRGSRSEDENLFYRDVARHALWSATLTQFFGYDLAQCILTAHEIDFAHLEKQTIKFDQTNEMDFFNNYTGSRLGLMMAHLPRSSLKPVIWKAIREGYFLMYDPYGKEKHCANRKLVPTIDPEKIEKSRIRNCL